MVPQCGIWIVKLHRTMNIFATDHPLVSQPKMPPRLSCLCQVLVVAPVLFALLSGFFYWISITTNEDVPGPSWTDYVFVVPWFLAVFPAALFTAEADYVSLTKVIFVLGADSLFWGFLSVSLYRMFRRCIQKRRFMPPNKSLQATPMNREQAQDGAPSACSELRKFSRASAFGVPHSRLTSYVRRG
jgi:hypothetical protein